MDDKKQPFFACTNKILEIMGCRFGYNYFKGISFENSLKKISGYDFIFSKTSQFNDDIVKIYIFEKFESNGILDKIELSIPSKDYNCDFNTYNEFELEIEKYLN